MLTDWRGVFTGDALAVAMPSCTDETARVVRACASAGVAVVPQGGNTGLSGGAVPAQSSQAAADGAGAGDGTADRRPSLVLSLRRMDRVVSVDPDRWTITAQAGATIEGVQRAAASAGRLFAPDWGARGSATVGGSVSTNAGGGNVIRYGTMRDNVIGLEAVLPDGRVWNGLRALRKDSSGFDLKHLLIGAEGTLGVVTAAVLRLHPATPFSCSALAAVGGLDRLARLMELIHSHGRGAVTAFELIPADGLDRACDALRLGRPLRARTDFYVLVKLTASDPVEERLGAFLEDAAERGWITDAAVAVTSEQETRLWNIRDGQSPTFLWPDFHGHGLKADAAVPVDLIACYCETVTRLAADLTPDASVHVFGHIGDGNLHVMVLPTAEEQVKAFQARRDTLQARMDEAVFAVGGTLSAEHGIGQLLRHRVGPQKPPVEWEVMRTVKTALDPLGIMNPGKTLPDGV